MVSSPWREFNFFCTPCACAIFRVHVCKTKMHTCTRCAKNIYSDGNKHSDIVFYYYWLTFGEVWAHGAAYLKSAHGCTCALFMFIFPPQHTIRLALRPLITPACIVALVGINTLHRVAVHKLPFKRSFAFQLQYSVSFSLSFYPWPSIRFAIRVSVCTTTSTRWVVRFPDLGQEGSH